MGDASDILPPSEIEALYNAGMVAAEANDRDAMTVATARLIARMPALLRHLRALTASADGEALGFRVYLMIEWGVTECAAASVVAGWERLRGTKRREQYEQLGADLHATGHAAGALSREGEIARLTAERDHLKRREADIIEATDPADGGQYRADIVGAIKRLRRERDTARDEGARVEREAIRKDFAARYGARSEFVAALDEGRARGDR